MGTDYETIAVSPETKKKFKMLKQYKQTDGEFLSQLLKLFEEEKNDSE